MVGEVRLGHPCTTVPALITTDVLLTTFYLGFYLRSIGRVPIGKFHINGKFRNMLPVVEKFRDRKRIINLFHLPPKYFNYFVSPSL